MWKYAERVATLRTPCPPPPQCPYLIKGVTVCTNNTGTDRQWAASAVEAAHWLLVSSTWVTAEAANG